MKRHRHQLEFGEPAYNRLLKLRERAEKPTNAETVRAALRVLEWMLDQKEAGAKIRSEYPDGTVKQIELL